MSPVPCGGFQRLSLGPDDGDDPLLLVITPEVQVALALHGPAQKRQLLMRCDPATLSDVLVQLGGRLEHQSPAQAEQLRKALESIGSLQSNAAWSEQFWPPSDGAAHRHSPRADAATHPG